MTLHALMTARPARPMFAWTAVLAVALPLLGCTTAETTASENFVDTTTYADTAAGLDTTETGDTSGLPEDTGVSSDATAQTGPAAPKVYEGTCPTFKTGTNILKSNGYDRRMRVALPEQPQGAPVVFIWHGLGDTAENMANYMGDKTIAKNRGAIVVTLDSCCNHPANKACCPMMTGWGFAGKPESDLALFDDTLACLDQTYAIDRTRVYTTGFSAGALWSTWLLMHRADQLAAAVLFSGGINSFVKWVQPAYRLPVLVAWGGAKDLFSGGIVNFAESAAALTKNLRENGHFVVSCNHGLGHSVPTSGPKWATDFLFQHTWSDGSSPLASVLSELYPSYCEIAP
jgi:predicted esterase